MLREETVGLEHASPVLNLSAEKFIEVALFVFAMFWAGLQVPCGTRGHER